MVETVLIQLSQKLTIASCSLILRTLLPAESKSLNQVKRVGMKMERMGATIRAT
jgi:hypothetical protein